MTCPHCGQNNFRWARRCDHCGRPLSSAAAPSSAANSPASSPSPPVGIEGQTLTFNGVAYSALARSRQLNDADVYPLRHQLSELVMFEAKVFRCQPGTPAYDEVKGRPPRAFRTKAELSDMEASGAQLVVDEIYEQGGRLLGLQRAYREHPGPAYHAEQMAAAQALLQQKQFAEAVARYDAILTLNPHHAPALGNKGMALMSSGNIEGSLACFERCVGIDANLPEPQFNMALCLAVTGRSEQATLTLARLLKRYSWSFDHWRALVQTAVTEDTLDLAQRFIDTGLTALAGTSVGDRVHASMHESRTRWQTYLTALEQARSQQIANQWAGAIDTLDRCSALSRRHAVAALNRAICLYHLSDMVACRNVLRTNHHRFLGDSHTRTSLLLWLLSAASVGDWQGASAVVRAFEQHLATGVGSGELPRVPVAALPQLSGDPSPLAAGSSIETMDVAPIVTALTGLAARPEARDAAGAIDVVLAAYNELASR